MERHPRIFAKQLLIFSVAVDDSTSRRVHHNVRIFDQLEDELRLAAPGRPCHECREKMAQRQSHVSTLVDVVTAERRRRKPRKEAIKALSELTNSVSAMYTISRCCCCCWRSSTKQSIWYVPFDILVRLKSRSSVNVLPLPFLSTLLFETREKGRSPPRVGASLSLPCPGEKRGKGGEGRGREGYK